MFDPFLIFGELAPDGAIKRDVRICAVTGKKIVPGDAMIPIPGTGRFYRVKAQVHWQLTPERKALIEAQLQTVQPAAPVVSPAKPSKSKETAE